MVAAAPLFPVHQPSGQEDGSTTFRREEKQRGLEPDECYCQELRSAD